MSSIYKFKVGDIVEHIGGRGNTGKVTRVTADKITVVFEDSSKDYNYNSDTQDIPIGTLKTYKNKVELNFNPQILLKFKI